MSYARLATEHRRPHCWACGRGWSDKPDDWFASWRIERAHVAAGSGTMVRQQDVRAVVLLCSRCHLSHSHNGETVLLNGELLPGLSDANVLWLKGMRDVIDWEYLRGVWLGTVPEPVEPPQWYLDEYECRHPWDHLVGD